MSADLLGAALDTLDPTDREATAAAQPALKRLLDALLTASVPGDAPHRS